VVRERNAFPRASSASVIFTTKISARVGGRSVPLHARHRSACSRSSAMVNSPGDLRSLCTAFPRRELACCQIKLITGLMQTDRLRQIGLRPHGTHVRLDLICQIRGDTLYRRHGRAPRNGEQVKQPVVLFAAPDRKPQMIRRSCRYREAGGGR
jgi:hypothetical protein